MRLDIPDPAYTASRRSRQNFSLAVRLSLAFVGLIWLVFLMEWLTGLSLSGFGLRPREPIGLLGLITTPLLHGSLAHISSNSLPLFVGGVAILFLYPNSSLRVLPLIYLGSAALAWTFARPSVHIGASGLVYGILAYVFVAGILRRDIRSVGVSLMIWFFYGSMIWGVLPAGRPMSWELHATGLLLGVVLAFVYRQWDRPPLKRYDWEDEDEDDEPPDDDDPDFPAGWSEPPSGSPSPPPRDDWRH